MLWFNAPIRVSKPTACRTPRSCCLRFRFVGNPHAAPTPRRRPSRLFSHGDTLPITLIPSDHREFKLAFIEAGVAEIREYYQDGSCKAKPWRKRGYGGFSEKSNAIGNLRSRAEYRAGTWQESGIVCIEVEVKR